MAIGAVVAALVLPWGAEVATGQDATDSPVDEPSTDSPTVAASLDPSPLPDDPAADSAASYRLRARVKLGPAFDFGAPKSIHQALGTLKDAACSQTHNLLWDGKPTRSLIKLRMIRQEGDPETSTANPPSGTCATKEQRVSGYRLRVKVSYPAATGSRKQTGRLKLTKAFSVLAEKMNSLREEVMATGASALFNLRLIRLRKEVPGMIDGLATRYGLSVSKSLSVAKCESGFDPKAYNPAGPWAGVYQQDTDYWPERAKAYGHPGDSVFDAYANIEVSLKMARSTGWQHWACA